MQIRKAIEADFQAVLAIYNQTILSHYITGDLEIATIRNRQKWFDFHLDNPKYPLWVLEDNTGVIGWFSFSPFYERPAFQHTCEISLYIDDSARGKGYGSQIIEFMQAEMLNYGIHTLMAYVFELNKISMNLLRKHHFEYWGRLPNIANMGKDEQGQDKWRTLTVMAYQKGITSGEMA